jgi:hypothetical protein
MNYECNGDLMYFWFNMEMQGGFARCYEVTDLATGGVYACKVVNKSMLKKAHQRDKMTMVRRNC